MDVEDRYVEVRAPLPWPRPGGRGVYLTQALEASREADLGLRQPYEAIAVRVRYVVKGEGPAVVLVHGLGASLAVWGENIDPLAEGHSVYALDLPGHGKSDKPEGLTYDAVSGAHFLANFMDTMGIASATLIGNSAGGLVTAICALAYPQRVDKLVLVDTAGLGRQLAWFLRLASVPFLGELLQMPNVHNARSLIKSIFYEPRAVSDAVVQELMLSRNIPEAKRAVLKAIRSGMGLWGLSKRMMVLQRLQSFTKPLLVIWGREDRIIPVSHAYRAAKVLSNSKVHVIPCCGHWPQMEKAEEFNPLVLRFLRGTLEGDAKIAFQGS